jgi:hypothetical protein
MEQHLLGNACSKGCGGCIARSERDAAIRPNAARQALLVITDREGLPFQELVHDDGDSHDAGTGGGRPPCRELRTLGVRGGSNWIPRSWHSS